MRTFPRGTATLVLLYRVFSNRRKAIFIYRSKIGAADLKQRFMPFRQPRDSGPVDTIDHYHSPRVIVCEHARRIQGVCYPSVVSGAVTHICRTLQRTMSERLFGFFFRSYNTSFVFYVELGGRHGQTSDDADAVIAPLETPYNKLSKYSIRTSVSSVDFRGLSIYREDDDKL